MARRCAKAIFRRRIFLPLILAASCLYVVVFVYSTSRPSSTYGQAQQLRDNSVTTVRNVSAVSHVPPTRTKSQGATNIYFMKVPKTGSSTMSNIVNRYALTHNLSAATYADSPTEKNQMRPRLAPRSKTRKFNIVTLHSKFRLTEIEDLLYTDNLKFLTIIREPLAQMTSNIYMYFKELTHRLRLNRQEPMKQFLEKLSQNPNLDEAAYRPLKNIQSDFFMIPRDMSVNDTKFGKLLDDVNKRFLVGLTEYYTETLVLMRRVFKWDHRAISLMALRVAKHPIYAESAERKIFCAWSQQDCKLYDYFNKTFWEKVQSEGKDFYKEVDQVASMNHEIKKFCDPILKKFSQRKREGILDGGNVYGELHVESNSWSSSSFTVSPMDCVLMHTSNPPFNTIFRFYQNPHLCGTAQRALKNWARNSALAQVCKPGDGLQKIIKAVLSI